MSEARDVHMKRPRSSRRKGPAHDLGPDNLHADLGLPNADERLLKPILVSRIRAAVVDRKLTPAKARKIMDLSSGGVSDLLAGAARRLHRRTACQASEPARCFGIGRAA